MAGYKYGSYLKQNNHEEYDKEHSPGEEAYNAGIYRCTGCGDEIAIAKGHTLPPQNHHQHTPGAGRIRWQLLVLAVSQA
jgi:hypothetical protein